MVRAGTNDAEYINGRFVVLDNPGLFYKYILVYSKIIETALGLTVRTKTPDNASLATQ